MKKFFLLSAKPTKFAEITECSELIIPLNGHNVANDIKKRTPVTKDSLLATHPSLSVADRFAPFDGVVQDVRKDAIVLSCKTYESSTSSEESAKCTDEDAIKSSSNNSFESISIVKDKASLALEISSNPENIREQFKQLGVALKDGFENCETLIINTLNPEPGVCYTESLYTEFSNTIWTGLDILKRIIDPKNIVVAIGSSDVFANLPSENTKTVKINPIYPNSLEPLLIKSVTGKETNDGVYVLSLRELFNWGLVATSGKPLTTTIINVMNTPTILPIGCSVNKAIEHFSLTLENNSVLVLGGLMRGQALAHSNKGIDETTDALLIVKNLGAEPNSYAPCVNCGLCVSACPMRLRPDLLSKYSEFQHFDLAKKANIDICINCGICGYVCPSLRPMQQYLHLAKLQSERLS